MSKNDVHGVLCDVRSWQAATLEQREAFCKEMQQKQYGIGPLQSAWGWFAVGWKAAKQ